MEDLDAALDNLNKAKNLQGDPAEKREKVVNQIDKAENYEDRANYVLRCPECGVVSHRIQLKGKQRELADKDSRGCCPECGSDDVAWEEK